MSGVQNTTNWNSVNQYQFLYRVKLGESLYKIISDQYHSQGDQRESILKQILADNPEIKNPDLIKANQLILLKPFTPSINLPPETFVKIPTLDEIASFKKYWENLPGQQQDAIEQISPIYNYLSLGSVAVGANLTAINSLMASNVGPLNGIPQAYTDYRNGKISKGQYDHLRKSRLNAFKQRIGPVNRLLYGSQTPNQVFRMKKGGGIAATKPVVQNIDRLSKIANVAAKGGAVLTVVGLAASCHQIANSNDRLQKNVTAVETITSTGVGVALGLAAGFFLVSNPVGWGVALVIGASTALTSYGAGKLVGLGYSEYASDIDVEDALYIDKVCN